MMPWLACVAQTNRKHVEIRTHYKKINFDKVHSLRNSYEIHKLLPDMKQRHFIQ